MGTVFFLWMSWQEIRLCRLALAFDRLAKAKYIRFQRTILRTASRRFPAHCCRSPCCAQVRHLTCS